eukprot:GHVT01014845.1.p1 GENE.GHVT01014845.1~~GHVT01014845.1.p1  ORF type:complete len:110 (-),score=2.69 GHVT01014845.1:49-378(-)
MAVAMVVAVQLVIVCNSSFSKPTVHLYSSVPKMQQNFRLAGLGVSGESIVKAQHSSTPQHATRRSRRGLVRSPRSAEKSYRAVGRTTSRSANATNERRGGVKGERRKSA